jgi:hypothetical protein
MFSKENIAVTCRLAMQLQETIICTAAPQVANADHGAIGIHDFETGSSLASFKHTNAGVNCTALVESKNAQGGFVLSLQRDKAVLNVYSFQKVCVLFLYVEFLERLSSRYSGPNCIEDDTSRKTHVHCGGPQR